MKRNYIIGGLAWLALIASSPGIVTIDWVTVGDANNPTNGSGVGAVAYEYKIGVNPVTVAQYAEFLNAKAQSNSYGLYNTNMASPDWGAIQPFITRSGTDGSYTYTVATGRGNDPVVYSSWFDAARFTNWMANGQGTGDTETGSYTLNGATSGIIAKNVGATIWIPTADEWYKAAFYDPTKNGTGGYWNFSTRTDATITGIQGDPGSANFLVIYPDPVGVKSGGQVNGLDNQITPVGYYGADHKSYYGTNDQSGNVAEWTDEVNGSNRSVRGGAFNGWQGTVLEYRDPGSYEQLYVGFRLAAIPEPSSILMGLFSGMLLFHRKRSI